MFFQVAYVFAHFSHVLRKTGGRWRQHNLELAEGVHTALGCRFPVIIGNGVLDILVEFRKFEDVVPTSCR